MSSSFYRGKNSAIDYRKKNDEERKRDIDACSSIARGMWPLFFGKRKEAEKDYYRGKREEAP